MKHLGRYQNDINWHPSGIEISTGVESALFYFNSGKSQLDSFDQFNNCGSIDVITSGCALEETSSFKILGSFSSKLDWGFYVVSIAKNSSKKIGVLIRSMKFLSLEVAICLYKFN